MPGGGGGRWGGGGDTEASIWPIHKCTVFALSYFVFEPKFPSTSLQGAYIWRGDLTEGFLRYRFGGLIHGGAYFRNFTVFLPLINFTHKVPDSQFKWIHFLESEEKIWNEMPVSYVKKTFKNCLLEENKTNTFWDPSFRRLLYWSPRNRSKS